MENLTLIKPEKVQNIINKFCYTIGMIPTSYKISLTYEEQIIAIGHYLEETVIPALNNNAEAVAELQSLFIQLKDYVENYFDNLDVQNEINNKLDAMAQDGTLQEIISSYLNSKAIFGYDNVNDMKNATNLINGSFVETFGYYSANDGGGATYLIRERKETDIEDLGSIHFINNTLVAELVCENETVNIIQFGAIKNDETKVETNTNAIQNAVNYAKKIIVPEGVFYCSSIELPFKTILEGTSIRTSKLFYKGNSNSSLLKIGNTTTNIFNVYVKNLWLESDTNIENVNAIEFIGNNPAFHTIDNVFIMKFSGDGIKGGHTGHVNNIEIKNSYFQYCKNGINMQYKEGQINAIYIYHNDITRCLNAGILFAGNNVIIESNTIQLNGECAISVGESNWDKSFTQYTQGSVIRDNYFEQNANNKTENASIIELYSGYDPTRAHNRFINGLTIENNYSYEVGDKFSSFIKVVKETVSNPSIRSEMQIHTRDNVTNLPIVNLSYNKALSFGSTIYEHSAQAYKCNIPYYVKTTVQQNFGDVAYYNNMATYQKSGSVPANKQITFLIYSDEVKSNSPAIDSFMRMLLVKASILGDKPQSYAGRFDCRLDSVGCNGVGYGTKEFKEDSVAKAYVPRISPITVVENYSEVSIENGTKYCYQFTIQAQGNAVPYGTIIEVLSPENLIKSIKIKTVESTEKTSSGAPTSTPNYIGEVCFDTTNSKWYYAKDSTTWAVCE